MASIKLKDILPDLNSVESYIAFRSIDDWCYSHIPKDRWRFDYSATICAHGVDIPGRIFFWREEDLATFCLQFGVMTSVD